MKCVLPRIITFALRVWSYISFPHFCLISKSISRLDLLDLGLTPSNTQYALILLVETGKKGASLFITQRVSITNMFLPLKLPSFCFNFQAESRRAYRGSLYRALVLMIATMSKGNQYYRFFVTYSFILIHFELKLMIIIWVHQLLIDLWLIGSVMWYSMYKNFDYAYLCCTDPRTLGLGFGPQ